MEMFDPLLMQTPRLEVEHTHGIRFGFKAVWDLRRKYAVSAGALAGKQTLLGEDGNQMARHETYLALSNVFRRSPMGTIRSASRAYFVWQGYRRALRGYGVDLKLRLLVPHGATLEELYGPTQTLLAYHLPERVEAESAAQAAGRK
jgi:hypothetical protein